MKMDDAFSKLLFLILIVFSKEECQEDEIFKKADSCILIEKLLNDPTTEIDYESINYLSRTIKKISKNGYDINFFRTDNNDLQSRDILKSNIYISKKCISLLEKKLNVDISIGIIMTISNNNNKNGNGIPERYFVIRFSGSGPNAYISSKNFDFSLCNKDPILLNLTINIDEVKAYKKKEKENAKSIDIYELTNIDLKKVLYAKNVNIDLFDPQSEFLENICFKFTSEKNTDVTLETRLSDYFQNVTLCDIKENAHYNSFNYSSSDRILYYCCDYGFYKNEDDKMSYIDKLDSKMNIIFTNSNFKVITCYKEILNYRQVYKNYGELICLFVLLMQLIFFMSFCCKGNAPLKNQIDKLLSSAPKISPILQMQLQENKNNENSERQKMDKNIKVNDNPQYNVNNNPHRIIEVNNNLNNDPFNNGQNHNGPSNNFQNNDNNSLYSNIKDADNNFDLESHNEIILHNEKKNKNVLNPPPKNKKRKSVILGKQPNDLRLDNVEDATLEGKKKRRRKTVNLSKKAQKIIINNIDKNDLDENNKTYLPEIQEENIKKKNQEREKKEKEDLEEAQEQVKRRSIIKMRSSQIFDFDNDDLNELTFDEAKIFDKRSFCKYYGFMIQISNIIINTFCRCGDYNLFAVKLGLLLLLFPINLTFNSFFFTSNEIKSVYINKITDVSIDWKNFARSFASSILSSIILIFLKLLSLTHHRIRKLKKETNIEEAKRKSVTTLKCVTFRVTLYYLLSLIFILICGIYVSCFCAIFENTQLILIERMVSSWFLSLIYPFAICFFTTIFRKGSLTCGKRGNSFCFKINKILQMV